MCPTAADSCIDLNAVLTGQRLPRWKRVGCVGGMVVAEATLCNVGMVKSLPVKQSFNKSK